VHPKGQISIDFSIKNNTAKYLNQSLGYKLYLSTNTTLETAADLLFYTGEIFDLAANQNYTDIITATIPENVTEGKYYIILKSDTEELLLEENKANNLAFKQITVLTECTDALEPNNKNIAAVEINRMQYAANNLCLSLTDTDWFKFLVGDKYYYFVVKPATYGKTGNYNLNVSQTGSNLTIQTLSPDNIVQTDTYIELYNSELNLLMQNDNFNNTVFSKLVYSLPTANLVAPEINLSSSAWLSGQQISIQITTSNQGALISELSKTAVYLSVDTIWDAATDLLLDVFDIQQLMPFSSITNTTSYSVPFSLNGGSYFVLSIVDYSNLVAESDEKNTFKKSIAINSNQPDLKMELFSFTPTNANAGSVVALSYTINNISAYSSAVYSVGVFLSKDSILKQPEDELIENFSYAALAAGGTITYAPNITIPRSTPQGTWYLITVIDPLNSVVELSKSNNRKYKSIAVVNTSTCIDENEPNNTYASAKLLPLNQSKSICIDVSDSDIFKIEVLGKIYYVKIYSDTGATGNCNINATIVGNNLVVKTTITTTAFDTYLQLYNESFTLLASDDDLGGNLLSQITYALPFSDLKVNALSTGITSYVPGSDVVMSVDFINSGNLASNSVYGKTFLSVDNLLDAADIRLNEFAIPSIQVSAIQNIRNSFTLPTNITQGNYYFIVNIDAENFEIEISETNNNSALATLIAQPLAKNITATAFNLAGNTIEAGKELNLSLLLTNSTANATKSYAYTVSIFPTNNPALKTTIIEGETGIMMANEVFVLDTKVVIPLNLVTGDYTVELSADPNNLVTETVENDNTFIRSLAVQASGLPNLYIKNIQTDKSNYNSGNSMTVTYSLANKGTTTVSAGVKVDFYLSSDFVVSAEDIKLSEYTVSATDIQAATNLQVQLNLPNYLPTGFYKIIAVADLAGTLLEVSENDNSAGYSISVTSVGCADAFEPNNFAGAAYSINGTGLNKTGLCLIAADKDWFKFKLFDKTYYFAIRAVNTTLTGDYDLVFNLSGRDLLIETKTSGKINVDTYIELYDSTGVAILRFDDNSGLNNYAKLTYTFPQPDFYITDLIVNQSVLVAGTSVIVTGVLNNSIAFTSSNAIGINAILSADAIISNDDLSLNSTSITPTVGSKTANFNYTYTIPEKTNAGSYYIIVQVDGAKAIIELNDTNNTAFTTIFVNSAILPDYIPINKTINKTEFLLSETIDVTFNVKNIGATNASAQYSGIYLSKDKLVDASDVLMGQLLINSLASGGVSTSHNAKYTIPNNIPLGYYYVLLVADKNLTIVETDESNNLLYSQIKITAYKPDLTVEITKITPGTVSVGNSILVEFNVKNIGTVVSPTTKAELWLPLRNNKTQGIRVQYDVAAINAGATLSISKSVLVETIADVGLTPLSISIDPLLAVDELIETNNTADAEINILSADFNISNLTVQPLSGIEPGQSITVSATIQNTTTSILPEVVIDYYFSLNAILEIGTDIHLGFESLPSIQPSLSYVSIKSFIISSTNFGTNRIFAVVNATNTVTETNKANNQLMADFNIKQPSGPADLQIIQAIASLTEVIPGIPFATNIEVKNTGLGYSAINTLKVYYSDDNSLTASDPQIAWAFVNPLLPGASGVLRIETALPVGITQGTHSLFFVVDPLSSGNDGIAEISLFPNPASDEFYVWVPNAVTKAKVEVITLSGNRVLSTEFTGNSVRINTNQLAQGMYLVKIDNGTEIITRKLVISKE